MMCSKVIVQYFSFIQQKFKPIARGKKLPGKQRRWYQQCHEQRWWYYEHCHGYQPLLLLRVVTAYHIWRICLKYWHVVLALSKIQLMPMCAFRVELPTTKTWSWLLLRLPSSSQCLPTTKTILF